MLKIVYFFYFFYNFYSFHLVELVSTNRGGYFLIHNGYRYFKTKSNSDNYWACVEKCGAKIIIKEDRVLVKGEHGHDGKPGETLVKKAKAKINHLAKNTSVPLPQIYESARNEFALKGGAEFIAKFSSEASFRIIVH